MRGVYFGQVGIHVTHPGQEAWTVRHAIDAALKRGQLTIRNRPVNATVQSPPWKRECLSQAGKFLGLMRKEGIPRENILVDQWGPPIVKICAIDDAGNRPVPLASFMQKGTGWKIQEGVLQKLKPTLTASGVIARLA